MTLVEVHSSNIRRVGYENRTLYVEYPSGLYAYIDVPPEKFIALLNADSKGQYLNSEIKGYFSYSKVQE